MRRKTSFVFVHFEVFFRNYRSENFPSIFYFYFSEHENVFFLKKPILKEQKPVFSHFFSLYEKNAVDPFWNPPHSTIKNNNNRTLAKTLA